MQEHTASKQQSLDLNLYLTISHVHGPSDPCTLILVKWIYQKKETELCNWGKKQKLKEH